MQQMFISKYCIKEATSEDKEITQHLKTINILGHRIQFPVPIVEVQLPNTLGLGHTIPNSFSASTSIYMVHIEIYV